MDREVLWINYKSVQKHFKIIGDTELFIGRKGKTVELVIGFSKLDSSSDGVEN